MVVFIDVIKAILARLLLIVHAFISVWRVVEYKEDLMYWLLLLPLVGTIADMIYILWRRKGEEWKWFSPSIFFYLGSVLPCIWWLELGRLYDKKEHLEHLHNPLDKNDTHNTSSGINLLADLDSYVQLQPSQWTQLIEQVMLCVLIISRWLMPLKRNHMTRDQLSQLLLVYLGLAADIVELLAIFDEPGLIDHVIFTFAILAAWSWSLMQFTLVLTATRGQAFKTGHRDNDVADADEHGSQTSLQLESAPEKKSSSGCFCCENETWSILVMLAMLDAPFLVLRLLSIFMYSINTYTIYFFTGKNILVCILQFYRLVIVISAEMKNKRAMKREEAQRLKPRADNGNGLYICGDSDVRKRTQHATRSR
ncbi:transmembrane protein 26-like [Lineus longissimus]|uniref:transmembrane protein 26-like n=1 Tax=Lineus longissimus TaxID=88925 RepID=UPI002B4E1EB9